MTDTIAAPGIVRPSGPITSSEFVNTMSHFHRAEIARMAGWRDRLDRTSNWALTVTAGPASMPR